VREGCTGSEAERRIKATRRLKEVHRARLQTEARITTDSRLPDQMPQHRRCDATTQMGAGGTHGFDFGVRYCQVFEGAKSSQRRPIPDAPERDVAAPKASQVQGVAAFRRGRRRHRFQMLAQQFQDLRAFEVVESNVHGLFPGMIRKIAKRARLWKSLPQVCCRDGLRKGQMSFASPSARPI